MLSLNDREWKDFLIKDVFPSVERGKRLKTEDHIDGDIPYVSSTADNNGVDAYIGNEKRIRIFSDCISIANSGSVGSSFYEPFDYIASDHVTHLKRDGMTENQYLAASVSSSMLSEKYDFNREINDYRISREHILLPVTDNGEPDYEFMEQYVKQVKDKKIGDVTSFIQNELSKIKYKDIPALEEKNWNEFEIKDIFQTFFNKKGELQVPTGANVNKVNLHEGLTPRITVTAENNGVFGHYDSTDKNYRIYSNIVSVSFLGGVFYHPYDVSLDMKVHALIPLDFEWNTWLAEFFIDMILNNSKNSDYGNQLSATDLPHKRILLPINDNGKPDREFMEQYVKNIMIRKYEDYLDFVES